MIKKLFIIFCLSTTFVYADNGVKPPEDKKEERYTPANKEQLKEQTSETTHTIKIDGVDITYTATAGTYLLQDEQNNKKASLFYIAYVKNDVENKENRPITFCFNGGPGSASVWLHMGLLGPQRVDLSHEGSVSPPYRYIPNEFSLLDQTDLVFIDPISTGFSRTVPGEDPKQYHGVDEDIKSVGEFIRLYITRENRWLSPKFLCGESYGTTRAAGLAGHLQEEFHMDINGIALISAVLNFQTLDKMDSGNDLPHLLYLPAFAATAWYHKKLPADLQAKDLLQVIAEVEEFTMTEYSLALMRGKTLSDEQKAAIIEKLVRYTGLSPQYIERSNLRISALRFEKELMKDKNRVLGRFDSRFQGIDLDACSDSYDVDPSTSGLFGSFTATFNAYIKSDLKWDKDEEYKILANVWPWNFGKAQNRFLNVTDTLQEVISRNPSVKVFVASGYYDLATPFFASDYTFNHIPLDPVLGNPVTIKYYEAGHMMYIHYPSLVKIRADLVDFYQNTLKNAHNIWDRLER